MADRFVNGPMTALKKRAMWGDGFTETQVIPVAPEAEDVRYAGTIVILLSGYSASAAETFLLPMIQLLQVTLMGDTSAGNFSDRQVAVLANGRFFSFSNEVYEDQNGVCYEGVGIVPNVPMEAFPAEDLENGTDSLIERAISLIEQG